MADGWKCPNCGKAHAPHVFTCPEPARQSDSWPPPVAPLRPGNPYVSPPYPAPAYPMPLGPLDVGWPFSARIT